MLRSKFEFLGEMENRTILALFLLPKIKKTRVEDMELPNNQYVRIVIFPGVIHLVRTQRCCYKK